MSFIQELYTIYTITYFISYRLRNSYGIQFIFTQYRLTLVLSCAMKFESYPHDTQVCSMQIESREKNNFVQLSY